MNRYKILLLTLSLLFICCDINEEPVTDNQYFSLTKIESYYINVSEPSGLSFSADSSFLWTVCDKRRKVYALDFTGRILNSFYIQDPYLDLEGICADPDGLHLWVVNEESREIIRCDLDGNILFRKRLLSGEDNSGLEGICYNPADSVFYLLKEKRPGLLLTVNSGYNVIKTQSLSFAADYSGMDYSSRYDALWIVSDQSRTLTLFHPDSGVLADFELDLENIEGVAVDEANGLLYCVSDSQSELYVYSLVFLKSKK